MLLSKVSSSGVQIQIRIWFESDLNPFYAYWIRIWIWIWDILRRVDLIWIWGKNLPLDLIWIWAVLLDLDLIWIWKDAGFAHHWWVVLQCPWRSQNFCLQTSRILIGLQDWCIHVFFNDLLGNCSSFTCGQYDSWMMHFKFRFTTGPYWISVRWLGFAQRINANKTVWDSLYDRPVKGTTLMRNKTQCPTVVARALLRLRGSPRYSSMFTPSINKKYL